MGRTLSEAKLNLLQFSLFITNIPVEWVSAEIIGTVYRLRWEVELIFKQWKSLLKIDVLQGICRYRVETLIWSRLCTVIIVASITATFMNLAHKYCNGELSSDKLVKYLMRNGKLCEAVKRGRVENLEKEMIQDIKRRLLKDKRSRTTMRERIISLEAYYEWPEYA
ncbi:MAG: transposase [Verrucomicrobia bacterium]|nr:transposase [Verrucomicrobiota bacterium]